MTRWTAEMIETLKKARSDGHSFSHCAEIVSRTHGEFVGRNAAIGKAKRIGLLNDGRSYAKSPKPKACHPRPFAAVNAVRRKERLKRSPKGTGMPPPVPVTAPIVAPIRFADLDRGQCRWCIDPYLAPAGPDMACCGAPVIDRFAPEGKREATHCRYHFEAGMGGGTASERMAHKEVPS